MFAFLSGNKDCITRESLSKIFHDDLEYSSRWQSYHAEPIVKFDKNIK